MKKILMVMVLGLCFCANTDIRESLTNGQVIKGGSALTFEVQSQQVITPSYSISWKADNIRGFSVIAMDYLSVSSGNSTTISAQPKFSNGVNAGNAVVVTAGTDLTDINSGYYEFTYKSNVAITTNVTFNFNVK